MRCVLQRTQSAQTSDGDNVYLFFSRGRAIAYVSNDSGVTWGMYRVTKKHPYVYPMGAEVRRCRVAFSAAALTHVALHRACRLL